MSSIHHTNGSQAPLPDHVIVGENPYDQGRNIQPSFTQVDVPQARPLSRRTVEPLLDSTAVPSSIPSSIAPYGILEGAQAPAMPVYSEGDLELPTEMPNQLELAVPETIPLARAELKPCAPIFKKIVNKAQNRRGDWSGFLYCCNTENEGAACRIAREDKRINFFFRVKDGAKLVLEKSPEELSTARVFYSGDTAFFSGDPDWGSAINYADGFVKDSSSSVAQHSTVRTNTH
jgi:hypothetical protein